MDIALVGIGKIAVDQHVPAIADSPDWTLAATVSRRGTVDGVAAYTDLGAMLEAHPEVRVVSLCLPPVPRFDYARQAIAAGRHVMLEKPPGATLAECHALATLAAEQRVCLFATWHSRAADMVPAAKAWLADKTLRRLQITWKENVRQWHPGQDWVFDPGGLGVFDPGINALSILTEILPVPVHLTRARLMFPENRHTPIAASCTFHHPGGAEVGMELDWLEPGAPAWRIEAETEEGTMVLDKGGAEMTVNGTPVARPEGALGEYPTLYAQMARLVKTGGTDMDLSPLRHVADAFMLGERITVEGFEW